MVSVIDNLCDLLLLPPDTLGDVTHDLGSSNCVTDANTKTIVE
jgi:hypothetical protein